MNSRSIQRQAAKSAYRKFRKNFTGLKKLQTKMSGAEKRRARMNGEQMLGVCPPFSVWLEAVKKPAQYKAEPEEVQEHLESLDWDE